MIFTKKDLQFLNLYSTCTDNSQVGKNFQVKKVKEDSLRFSQVTNDVLLFTDLVVKEIPENYCFNFPTLQIVQLLNTCGEKDVITIEENNIKFGRTSSYKFDQIVLGIDSQEKVLEDIKNNTKQVVSIKNLDRIGNLKYFVGTDKGLNFVPVMNGYFVATDRYDYGFVKTENDVDKVINLSKTMIDIFSYLKLKEVSIFFDDEKYFFNQENTFIILPKSECIIPNFFEDKWKSYYEFENKVIIKKEDILFALSRISVFARDNVNSRIFVTFNENEIKIESKDKGYAEERIVAEVDKALIGHYIIVSSNCLLTTINSIEDTNITIQIKPDKDSICISLWQKNKERFFINNILPYVD